MISAVLTFALVLTSSLHKAQTPADQSTLSSIAIAVADPEKPNVGAYQIRNLGQRPIAAWTVILTVARPNGTTFTMTNAYDTYRAAVTQRVHPGAAIDRGNIPPDGKRSVVVGTSPGDTLSGVNVSCVVFDDGSFVGNREDAARLFSRRDRTADAADRWIGILERADKIASPTEKLSQLKKDLADRQAQLSRPTDDEDFPGRAATIIEQATRTPSTIEPAIRELIQELKLLSATARRHPSVR